MASPTLWNVPYQQNQYFTGREETLRQLHRALRDVNAVGLTQPQGISGLGGIGKTQTVVEFAYRYGMEYEAVFWVRADSLTTLHSSFQEVARLLQLPERQEQDQRMIVEAVLRWFRQHSRWLLIFDNMDDLALAEPFLPKAGPGHLIFTTRSRAFGNVAQRLEILQMEPETGALLLLRRASIIPLQALLSRAVREDRNLACGISRVLDGLPLALDQAGAYIKETPSTLADYFHLYQQRREDLLNMRGTDSQDYPASVATTWSLSFEKVTQANPATTDLLTLCAFLAPDAIPETIFTAGSPYLGDLLAPVAANQNQFNFACGVALRYSLIARESSTETLTMHRLVQTILRANTPVKKQDRWRLMPATFSKRKTIATRQEWKQRAVLAVNAASPKVQDVEAWPACDVWVPHALVCADWIEQEQFYQQESTDMLQQAGVYLDARARYPEAEAILRRILTLYEQLFDSTHPYVAQALGNLGALLVHQGKYSAAEPLLKRVVDILEQQLKTQAKIKLNNSSQIYDNPQKYGQKDAHYRRWLVISEQDVAVALDNLGTNYENLGQHSEAEALYRRAQKLIQQQPGSETTDAAQNLSNLARLAAEKEQYQEAERLFKQALTMQQSQAKAMHPVTAEILNNIGEVYKYQKKYAEAESSLKQALEIREKIFGNSHPDTAISLDNLAVLYYEQGKYQVAEPLWKQALAIWQQHDHPEVAKSLNNLAELYKAQTRYEEAEPLLAQAVAVLERLLGANHPDIAAPLSNLALLYMELGKYQEGEPLLKRALAMREKALGTNHPSTLITRKNLETFYRNWKFIEQRQKADSSSKQEFRSGKQQPKADETATSLNAWAKQAENQGKYVEAERLYQRALALQERLLGANHSDVLVSLNKLARVYEAQHKYQEAENLFRHILELRMQQFGMMHPDTLQSLDNLAEICIKQGNEKAAEPFLKRAQAIRKHL